MELKPGYKQTEVGEIPDDWTCEQLSEFFTFISYGFTNPMPTVQDGVFMITAADINDGRLQLKTARKTSELAYRTLLTAKSKPRPNDILLTKDGTLGRLALMGNEVICINQSVAVIRPNERVAPHFLKLLLESPRYQKRMLEDAGGSTIKHIYITIVDKMPIGLPLKNAEQRAIATALSDVDALLDGLDRLIAKKRNLKHAAMQQLLTGETRLPGFAEEWEEKRLGDHVIFLRNGVNSRAELTTDDPVKYLHYGDIHASGQAFLAPPNLPSLPSERARMLDRLRDGDLVFADASEDLDGVGKSVEILDASNMECVAGLHTIAARFDKTVLADGFKGYLQFCSIFSRQLKRLAAGTKVYATNRAHIASIEMRLPEVDEQAAIATVLSDMDAEIAALEQRRDKTKDLKQAMMQELLTGRIRLIKPCESVAREVSKSTDAKPHSWAFNEAVVISTLAKHFGKEDFPLGRKRYTKLSYLLHRHAERQAEGYLKKAAGPYNPKTKYGGPERIALENGYIREHKNGRYSGFVAADNIAQAEEYFEKWYGRDAIHWLNQFRFKTNNDLEVLATVDMAAEELRATGQDVDVSSVKEVIRSHTEWKAKLDRAAFSDTNIANGIKQSHILFNSDIAGGPDA